MVKLLVILISLVVTTYSSLLEELLEGLDLFSLLSVDDPSSFRGIRSERSTLDRIEDHGYPVEQHHIVTEDDYVLGVFRIPYSHKLKNKKKVRPIVLLMHGLTCTSDIWIVTGPKSGLAYLLADAGYDVWLGNNRGNTYSRNHTTLSPDDSDFWKFSWHEIGYYDVAAMIDYALNTKNGLKQGEEAIHFVGHSQGTTVFFVLMSLRPEYNEKIKTAHMFAPIAFMKNLENNLIRKLSPYFGRHNAFSRKFSSREFLSKNDFVLGLVSHICDPDLLFHSLCELAVDLHFDRDRVNTTAFPEVLSTYPAGCSTNQILHYLQATYSGHFRQYDYGRRKNLKVYGKRKPPDYPVELITSDVHLWYSDNDDMAAVKDVLALAKRLPHRTFNHIEDPEWDHKDFVLNLKIRELVNEPTIEIMEEYENESV